MNNKNFNETIELQYRAGPGARLVANLRLDRLLHLVHGLLGALDAFVNILWEHTRDFTKDSLNILEAISSKQNHFQILNIEVIFSLVRIFNDGYISEYIVHNKKKIESK